LVNRIDEKTEDENVYLLKEFKDDKNRKVNIYEVSKCTLNFAELRNIIDEYAESKWILSIDMDEYFHYDYYELAGYLANGEKQKIGGFMVNVYLANEECKPSIIKQCKIYRNNIAKWKYRIHESIVQGIEESGYRLAKTNIISKHIGYNISESKMIAKHERNLPLMIEELYLNGLDEKMLMQLKFALNAYVKTDIEEVV
jgi:glycosyltransferase involved in cell wall biosynthesis